MGCGGSTQMGKNVHDIELKPRILPERVKEP
jgi:hypothetical protein